MVGSMIQHEIVAGVEGAWSRRGTDTAGAQGVSRGVDEASPRSGAGPDSRTPIDALKR